MLPNVTGSKFLRANVFHEIAAPDMTTRRESRGRRGGEGLARRRSRYEGVCQVLKRGSMRGEAGEAAEGRGRTRVEAE